jgi:hypothetical protein
MTPVIGSEARLTLRRDLRTLVYSAMTESFASRSLAFRRKLMDLKGAVAPK